MHSLTDSHVHFGKRENFDEHLEFQILKKELKKNNIKKIFIFPISPTLENNLKMYNAIKDSTHNFIPFLYLNPLETNSIIECEMLINDYYFKGIKLHPYVCKYRINHFKLLDPWMNIAMKYNCHIIVHCTSNDPYCSPNQLKELAQRYPQITFQMAHMGAIWQCSEAIKIIQETPNIYADSSIASFSAVSRALKSISDNLLIGTDYPFYKFEMEQLKIRLASPDEEILSKILYKNFDKIIDMHNY